MAQPTAEAPTPTPNTSTEAAPRRRSGRMVLVLAALLAGGTVLAALALFGPWQWPTNPTTGVAAPLPAAVAPAPDPALSQLTALAEQSRTMAASLATLSDQLQQLQTDVRAVKDKLDHPAPAADPTPAVSRACPRRVTRSPARQPVSARRPVAPVATDDTQLLSVDTWDNRPSIAWRAGDGSVRFAHDGENTPAGRLAVSPLDPSQSVRLVRPDGTSAVLRARETP